jgi:predicted RNA polymerase sigma factor
VSTATEVESLLRDLAPQVVGALLRRYGGFDAVAMVHGPRAGLRQLATAEADPALAGHYRVDAVRAHLLDLAGDQEAARACYRLAARRTLSVPEQRYLESRAAQLAPLGRVGRTSPG